MHWKEDGLYSVVQRSGVLYISHKFMDDEVELPEALKYLSPDDVEIDDNYSERRAQLRAKDSDADDEVWFCYDLFSELVAANVEANTEITKNKSSSSCTYLWLCVLSC